MFILLRSVPFLLPLLTGTLFYLQWSFKPYAYELVAISIILNILGATFLLSHQLRDKKIRIKSAAYIVFFNLFIVSSANLFLFFVYKPTVFTVNVGLVTLAQLMYLETIFLRHYYPQKYISGSLESIVQYSSLLNTFYLTSGLFSCYIFLKLPLLSLLPYLIIPLWLNFHYFFSLYDITHRYKNQSLVLMTLIITEFFYIMNVLPMSIFLFGTLMMLINFILYITIINHLRGTPVAPRTKRFLIIFLSILITTAIITARWT
jgi:hypothetical protein